MDLLCNLAAGWTSQHFSLVYSLICQRAIIPKVTGKARVTVALRQDITIPMMTKLFGIDANHARKQVTILIKGSIFIARKASPAPCCQTDNPQLAGPTRCTASSLHCHSSSPACFAKPGHSPVNWDIYTPNSQEATCDEQRILDPGGEIPQEQSNQHPFADTSTNKCRFDRSRCAAARVHRWSTEATFLADPILPGPKQVGHSSPVTRVIGTRARGRKSPTLLCCSWA